MVDVHDEVRNPLAISLDRQEEFEVVLAAGEPAQAIEGSKGLDPDLLLVDIRQLDKAVTLCREL